MNNIFHSLKKMTLDKFRFLILKVYYLPSQLRKKKKMFYALKENLKFKNRYNGQRCFILGNGPSLKKIDLRMFKNEYTFVVNHFFLHKNYKTIHPKFYSVIDPRFAKNDQFTKKFNKSLTKKIHKDTLFFLPIESLFLNNSNEFNKIHKAYLAMDHQFNENLNFNLKIDKPIPYLMNVILSCLIPAIYLGFKEIYLLGCEHDWCKYKTNENWEYFYKFKNKYNPNMFVPYERKLREAAILFQAYRLIKKVSPKVKIYNCTPNSYLDVFEYKPLSKNILKK